MGKAVSDLCITMVVTNTHTWITYKPIHICQVPKQSCVSAMFFSRAEGTSENMLERKNTRVKAPRNGVDMLTPSAAQPRTSGICPWWQRRPLARHSWPLEPQHTGASWAHSTGAIGVANVYIGGCIPCACLSKRACMYAYMMHTCVGLFALCMFVWALCSFLAIWCRIVTV